MVLAEWLEDAFARRDRRREEERAWKEWRTGLEEARAQGKPFTEPPPSFEAEVGHSPKSHKGVTVSYERGTDTLAIVLRDSPVAESEEPVPGLILNLGKDGEVVAIELLHASRKTSLEVTVGLG